MFLMGRYTNYQLAGMPMGGGMLFGMFLIVAGFAATAYGLLPVRVHKLQIEQTAQSVDGPLTRAHWIQIAILATALVIDIMKAASLGFVTPGMRVEYHLTASQVARVPFAGLLGTTVGSFLWGVLADIYGRRATILLAAVVFMGTAICGAMPSLNWNIFMCFLMGLGAGGMLPVAFALLAEIMPTRHRGWSLVLVGGIGSIGGAFATSLLSAALQPHFGWRILWLINMPIALILIFLSPHLQESASFLRSMGRNEEARQTLARFGMSVTKRDTSKESQSSTHAGSRRQWERSPLVIALTLTALCGGFVTFGVLLWLPEALIHEGRSVGGASVLLAKSSLLAAPAILIVTWMYSRMSSKWTLVSTVAVMALGLVALLLHGSAVRLVANPVVPVTLLILGANGLISVLLPYAAETSPLRIRARATGWVAGFSKVGGLLAQLMGMFALIPALKTVAGVIAIPCLACLALLAKSAHETLGKGLQSSD